MIHLTHHGIDSPQVTKVKHELLGVPGVNVSFFGSICDWGEVTVAMGSSHLELILIPQK